MSSSEDVFSFLKRYQKKSPVRVPKMKSEPKQETVIDMKVFREAVLGTEQKSEKTQRQMTEKENREIKTEQSQSQESQNKIRIDSEKPDQKKQESQIQESQKKTRMDSERTEQIQTEQVQSQKKTEQKKQEQKPNVLNELPENELTGPGSIGMLRHICDIFTDSLKEFKNIEKYSEPLERCFREIKETETDLRSRIVELEIKTRSQKSSETDSEESIEDLKIEIERLKSENESLKKELEKYLNQSLEKFLYDLI